jgi:hypothetical protein
MSIPPPRTVFEANPGVIELAPDLPMAEFTSTERWHPERIRALALYCSDGRWGDACDEFCQKHLLIPRYDRWAVPGGPAWLVADTDQPEFVQAARQQLDFLVRAHELEQLVLITHFGCAYYTSRQQQTPQECLPLQTADIRSAAATLRGWYPALRVDAYVAMRTVNNLSFHRLDPFGT